MSALLELSDVTVDVEGRPRLLDHLELTVAPGDRIALMGPSGSGKSTLLAVLGGLLAPTVGTVGHRGAWTGLDVAWVFQQTFLLSYRTVLDNVALAPLAAGSDWPTSLDAARAAVERVGLAGRADVPAGRISGGERQRVGVARVLAAPRPLVLADEPTASLDAELVVAVTRLLVEEADADSAVVVATHDSRVARLCDRVLRLDAGRLVQG